MKFSLKYLILPLSIIGCINTYNINAMENINENQIIDHNKGQIKINNQENNNFLKISTNNKNDEEVIKQLITKKITDIPTVKYLINHTADHELTIDLRNINHYYGEKTIYFHFYEYNDNQIHNLLQSFNSLESNKPFTIDQLTKINDIVKTINFFVQKDKEYKKKGLYRDYDFDFAISDEYFGIGLIHDYKDNWFDKCIFIQSSNDYLFKVKKNYEKNKQYKTHSNEITNKSFRNFLDVVKLCSVKKLPITFEDKNGRQYNNPYLITKNEYKNLLITLMKDFWISFYGEYKYDILKN